FWIVMYTLTTVGYGDNVPRTAAGKMVMTLVMIFSLFVIAFPLSMITMQYGHVVRVFVERQKAQADAMRRLKARVDQVRLGEILNTTTALPSNDVTVTNLNGNIVDSSGNSIRRSPSLKPTTLKQRFMSVPNLMLPGFRRAYVAETVTETVVEGDGENGESNGGDGDGDGGVGVGGLDDNAMGSAITLSGGESEIVENNGDGDDNTGAPSVIGDGEISLVADSLALSLSGRSTPLSSRRGRFRQVVKVISASLSGLNKVRAVRGREESETPQPMDEVEMDNVRSSIVGLSGSGSVVGDDDEVVTVVRRPARARTIDSISLSSIPAVVDETGIDKSGNGKGRRAQESQESRMRSSPEPVENKNEEDFAFPLSTDNDPPANQSSENRESQSWDGLGGVGSYDSMADTPDNNSSASSSSHWSILRQSIGSNSASRHSAAHLEVVKPGDRDRGVTFSVPIPRPLGVLSRTENSSNYLSPSPSSNALAHAGRGTPPIDPSNSASATPSDNKSTQNHGGTSGSHTVSVREVERQVDLLLPQHPHHVHLRVADWRLEYRERDREDVLRMRIHCKDEDAYRRLMKLLADFH
ncbi:hypothetical protein HDU76_006257, partial [Blyttiomyces sp. JEL0837]